MVMHEFLFGIAMQVLSPYVSTDISSLLHMQEKVAGYQRQDEVVESGEYPTEPDVAFGTNVIQADADLLNKRAEEGIQNVLQEAQKELQLPTDSLAEPALPSLEELEQRLSTEALPEDGGNLFDGTSLDGNRGQQDENKRDFAEILTDENLAAEQTKAQKKAEAERLAKEQAEAEAKKREEERIAAAAAKAAEEARIAAQKEFEKEQRLRIEEAEKRAREAEREQLLQQMEKERAEAEAKRQAELEAAKQRKEEEEKMRLEEQKKREEERKRLEEDKKRLEEQDRIMKEEQMRLQEEQKRMKEEQKRLESEAKKVEAERKKLEEEARKKAEQAQKEAEKKKKAAEEAKRAEEERRQAELEAKQREAQLQEEEAKKRQEEKAKPDEESGKMVPTTKPVAEKPAKSTGKTSQQTEMVEKLDEPEEKKGFFAGLKDFFSRKKDDDKQTTTATQSKKAAEAPKPAKEEPKVVGKHVDWEIANGKIVERTIGDDIDYAYIEAERKRRTIANQEEQIRVVVPVKKGAEAQRYYAKVPDILTIPYRSRENSHIPYFSNGGYDVEIFFDAIEHGDSSVLYSLASHISDMNITNSKGELPLNVAIRQNNYEAVDFLVSRGARVNEKDVTSFTPLHYAVVHQKLKAAYVLLSMGADPNIQDKLGKTPLMYAILARDRRCVYYILATHKVDFSLVDSEGNSVFSLLREVGDSDITNLIRYYFSVNQKRLQQNKPK